MSSYSNGQPAGMHSTHDGHDQHRATKPSPPHQYQTQGAYSTQTFQPSPNVYAPYGYVPDAQLHGYNSSNGVNGYASGSSSVSGAEMTLSGQVRGLDHPSYNTYNNPASQFGHQPQSDPVYDYLNDQQYASTSTSTSISPAPVDNASTSSQSQASMQDYDVPNSAAAQDGWDRVPLTSGIQGYSGNTSVVDGLGTTSFKHTTNGHASVRGYGSQAGYGSNVGGSLPYMADPYNQDTGGPYPGIIGAANVNPIFAQNYQVPASSLSHYQASSHSVSPAPSAKLALGAEYPPVQGYQASAYPSHPPNSPHGVSSIQGYAPPASASSYQAAAPYGMPSNGVVANGSKYTGRAVSGSSSPPHEHGGALYKKQRLADENDRFQPAGDSQAGHRYTIPPPVKNACLSCRSKKARCDGQQPTCGQCVAKGRECVFVKSRRGGARKKKDPSAQPAPTPLATFLKQLDQLQAPMGEPDDLGRNMDGLNVTGPVDPSVCVRTYAPHDLDGLLKCYYEEIHPFQPILPPIKHKDWVKQNLLVESPLMLAIRAILSLSPHPSDPAPKSLSSRALRRSTAARLARESSDRVDELLAEAGDHDDRQPSIECVQALCLLGLYEFAQTGNAVKNRQRMNQAVEVAMDMGLHQIDKATFASNAAGPANDGRAIRPTPAKQVEGKDVAKDMQRRTWWVTFAGMLVSNLVVGRRPMVSYDDKRIMTDYPATVVGDSSWAIWLESMGTVCQAMDIIMTLDYNMPDPEAAVPITDDPVSDDEMGGMADDEKKAAKAKKALHRRMIALDRTVLDLLKKGENMAVIPLVPGGEEEVVRNQQLSASMMLAVCHIQLHRRQAFPEVALFSKKMCGLPKAPTTEIPTPQQALSAYGQSQMGTHHSSDNDSQYGNSSQKLGSSVAGTSQVSHLTLTAPTLTFTASDQLTTGVPDIDNVDPNGTGNGVAKHITPLSQETLDALNASNFSMDGILWDSSIYPTNFPMPWFEDPNKAAALYQPTQEMTNWLPAFEGVYTADNGYLGGHMEGFSGNTMMPMQNFDAGMGTMIPPQADAGKQAPTQVDNQVRQTSTGPPASTTSNSTQKTHKAWGVDIAKAPVQLGDRKAEDDDVDVEEGGQSVVVGPDGPFPPGISLARVAQAAHSVIRLEVLHRSASLALWKGPPKWLPFCACGLLSGAYSFLLLSLAVQANTFSNSTSISADEPNPAQEELDALLTNVKVILAGLEAYGTMWDGIDMMAGEVRAALEAAKKLPDEIKNSPAVMALQSSV